jgi:hypothetical protein
MDLEFTKRHVCYVDYQVSIPVSDQNELPLRIVEQVLNAIVADAKNLHSRQATQFHNERIEQ